MQKQNAMRISILFMIPDFQYGICKHALKSIFMFFSTSLRQINEYTTFQF